MTTIIAEVKIGSPFGFRSDKSWRYLFDIANEIGDIISIHTDSRWLGSFSDIKLAKKLTKKPILAKGIHSSDDDIKKAVDCGADWVLVVGRVPGIHQEKCIVEPNDINQLKEFNWFNTVWNSRDLITGDLKSETFDNARLNHKGWLCQASNIKSPADIKKGADAIIVGECLENFAINYEEK